MLTIRLIKMKKYYYIKILFLIGLLYNQAWAEEKEFGLVGPYLSAKYAISQSNFDTASKFYEKILNKDPTNLILLNEALMSAVGEGDFKSAQKISKHYTLFGGKSNVSDFVQDAIMIMNSDYEAIIVKISDSKNNNALTSRLVKAWALLGNGEMAKAKEEFNNIAQNTNYKNQARYHEALAVAMVGDFEEADEILSGRKYGDIQLNNRGIRTYAQILIQVDKEKLALSLINEVLSKSPYQNFILNNLKQKIKKGLAIDYNFITNSRQGIAEVYFGIVELLKNRVDPSEVLMLSRLAEFLWPENSNTSIQVASLLEDLKQYELALISYSSIPQSNPNYLLAELGRANTLSLLEKHHASIEVLKSLAKSHPSYMVVHSSLGDAYRQVDRDNDAILAYGNAIDLSNKLGKPRWEIYFYRGMIFEKQKNFIRMEQDFQKALKLSPKQPDVLNFLGYSLVEQRKRLPEALDMIMSAAEERPQSGYIIDSLGWIYFRLGDYQAAVEPMEKAVKLQPIDPIINDHLGDVYWMVGRIREANFQWKRALSFSPSKKEAERIRRKLKLGLDEVLENEKLLDTKTANE